MYGYPCYWVFEDCNISAIKNNSSSYNENIFKFYSRLYFFFYDDEACY